MKIILDFQGEEKIRELSAMGDAITAATTEGLQAAGKLAAAHVQENFLSGQYLNVRTGAMRRTVDSWPVSPTETIVGVPDNSPVDKYKYLLGDETVTIKPVKGRYLAIPIGENLTGSGVAKFSSPRDMQDGFFLRADDGDLFFGRRNGKRGKFRPFFVLKTEVTVQGTGALIDGTLEVADDMTAEISDRIGKVEGVE